MDWLIKIEQDLNRIQKKIAKEIRETERHLAFLERSSDNCWGNPNPDEEYEKYTILMGKFERKLELFENLKNSMSSTQHSLLELADYERYVQSKLYRVPNCPLCLSLTNHDGFLNEEDIKLNLVKSMHLSNQYGEDWFADTKEFSYNHSGISLPTDEGFLEDEGKMHWFADEMLDILGDYEGRAQAIRNIAGLNKRLVPLTEEEFQYLKSESDTWTLKTIILEFLPSEENYF